MSEKRTVEYFTASCPLCDEGLEIVKRILCESCELEIRDLRDADALAKARSYGIHRAPAVVIDGKLADCCRQGAVSEATLRALGVGSPA